MYRLSISPVAEQDIKKLNQRLSRQDAERLRKAISSLVDEPRPQGVRKLKGTEKIYRIRVGNYRIVYKLYNDEQLIVVAKVVRRNETTYR